VAVIDAAGKRIGSVEGFEVEATGRMRDAEAVLVARFVGIDEHVWQAVVLGARPDREQAAQFLDSFALRR
jgi:hypothetical protein